MLAVICGSRSRKSAVSQPRDHGVGDGCDAAFLHRLDAVEPVGRIGIVAGGVGEDDLAEPLRRIGAEPLSDHAAHRQPAPMHLLDIEVVEDRQHVAAETLHRIGAGRHAGLAVAAAVVADDAKQLRQRLHLRLPHLQCAAQRIRQHQRRSAVAAFDGYVEQAAVGVDHRHGIEPCVMRGLGPRIRLRIRDRSPVKSLHGMDFESARALPFTSSSEASRRSISACETP